MIADRPSGSYFWHTFEMNSPMDDAETAVKLYYMLWGYTFALSRMLCCLGYFLYEMRSSLIF